MYLDRVIQYIDTLCELWLELRRPRPSLGLRRLGAQAEISGKSQVISGENIKYWVISKKGNFPKCSRCLNVSLLILYNCDFLLLLCQQHRIAKSA